MAAGYTVSARINNLLEALSHTERKQTEMRLTPATELEYRCSKLQKLMVESDLDAVIIVQNADLFYFTGTVQSGNLYVPAQGQQSKGWRGYAYGASRRPIVTL